MSGKQPVERIALTVPLPSILTSARPLPDGINWSTGIAWSPMSCIPSHAWPRCPDADTEKTVGSPGARVATVPFTIYTLLACEWETSQGGDRMALTATDLTEVHSAYAVARALWLGEGLDMTPDSVYGVPPTLRNSAVNVTAELLGNDAGLLDDVFSVLLAEYEACTGGNGGAILHVPTVLLPGALGGGGGGARVCWPEGNVYRGPAGATVSPGPGYPAGHHPQGADGIGPGSDGVYAGNGFDEAWVYVSGPVEYALGPLTIPNTDAERRQPFRANRYEVEGMREAIVRFDPCCVFAAKVINDSGMAS